MVFWFNSVEVEFENLPVAPPPEPRELTQEELKKMDRQREAVLRELRVFLRDATNKLLAERKFKEFVNPVNPEEVCLESHHLWLRCWGASCRALYKMPNLVEISIPGL